MRINIHLFSTFIEEELHGSNTEIIYSGLWNVCDISIWINLIFHGFISSGIAKPRCET